MFTIRYRELDRKRKKNGTNFNLVAHLATKL